MYLLTFLFSQLGYGGLFPSYNTITVSSPIDTAVATANVTAFPVISTVVIFTIVSDVAAFAVSLNQFIKFIYVIIRSKNK